MFCYTAADETGGFDVDDWSERERSAVSLPASMVRVARGFPGSVCCSGACDKTMNGAQEV